MHVLNIINSATICLQQRFKSLRLHLTANDSEYLFQIYITAQKLSLKPTFTEKTLLVARFFTF